MDPSKNMNGGGSRRANPPMSPNSSYQQDSYQDQQTISNNNNYYNPDMYEPASRSHPNGGGGTQINYVADIQEMISGDVNQTLAVPKAFYFFFFAAFGSVFPLLGIYFKQMAMSPIQVGFLLGLKPFVEFVAAPFWTQVGKRWRQTKKILLFSLLCWIATTLAIGFIHPPVHSCLMHNETHLFISKATEMNLDKQGRPRIKREAEEAAAELETRSGEYNSAVQSFEGLIKKRAAEAVEDPNTFVDENNKHWKVVNVTKIIRIKVRKTTKKPKTTEKLHHIVENGKEESKDKFEEAKDQAVNELLNDKTKAGKYADDAKDQVVNKIAASTKQPGLPIPIIGRVTLPISLDIATKKPDPQQIAITNYFDRGDLESAKKKGKIVVMSSENLNLIKPTLETSVVYHKDDVQKVFMVFLFFILAGEFFSAPAITLADQATIATLGPSRADQYGKQRMFGSIGWAISMFSVGLILDNAHVFHDHPCGLAGPDERNYTFLFAIFTVLMGFAIIAATQFKFDYGDEEGIPLTSMTDNLKSKVKKEFNPEILVNEPETGESRPHQFKASDEPETKSMYYWELLEHCKSTKISIFLLFVWFMGMGVGLVFTFLFWHLQDIGGSPTLYGFASVINHVSELLAYYFVNQLVRKYGHIQIFYAGLIGNCLRFVYVAVLTEPIWILPFEFIQGITHALVWATSASYFAQSVPLHLRPTAQEVLQSLHFGLGRGFGTLIGGFFISAFGSKVTFFLYGFSCFCLLFGYWYTNKNMMEALIEQNPAYSGQNQHIHDGGDASNTNNGQIPEFQNFSNPNATINDHDNYYYQGENAGGGNQDSFPVMSPHGVPSPMRNQQNWNSQQHQQQHQQQNQQW